MKFEEKLMRLRKDKALSQEELAKKLNVTRETISKWELGQTKPDLEKIVEIAKFFNVSADELLNTESDSMKNNNDNKETETKRNVIIVVLLITVLLILLGVLAFKFFMGFFYLGSKPIKNIQEFQKNVVDNIGNIQNQYNEKQNQVNSSIDNVLSLSNKQTFNHILESLYNGVQEKFFVEAAINEVIKSNQNNEKKITVEFDGNLLQSSEELAGLANKLSEKQYLISYEKDKEGFINKMIIKNV